MKTFGLYEEGFLAACNINGGGTGGGSGGGEGSGREVGTTWTLRSWGFGLFFGLTYGNGLFVAVGKYGTILTSRNGVKWIRRASGTSNDLNGVTYGNGIFVAVGRYGTILTSP